MRSILLFVILIVAAMALSQTTDDQHVNGTVAPSGKIIDGSVTPEKIPDADAYRLFLVTVAASTDATQEEKDQQSFLLQPVGLADIDLQSLKKILANFKANYEELIQSYNASAEAALAKGSEVDIKDFLVKRDTLVESTRSELASTLTLEGMTAFDARVQNEKKNMQVAVESAR